MIVTFLLYALLLTLNRKELFYELLIVNLSIVPIVISLIWMPVNKFIWTGTLRTVGFSGIVSSISGMVVYAYIPLLHEKIKINTFYAYLSSIFFIPLLFTFIYFIFTMDILMITILLAIIFFIATYKTIRTIDKKTEANLIKISKKTKTTKTIIAYSVSCSNTFFIGVISKRVYSGKCKNQLLHALHWLHNWHSNIFCNTFYSCKKVAVVLTVLRKGILKKLKRLLRLIKK
jgi:hypothetical protein